ncbi:MAG: hypothetical protein ACN6OS_18155 [Comamonas testosteroni]|uniref:hypothetical protein n=1 Tax=Comamonas testosteroni TaxID=285 RepID=UPI003D096A79
MTFEKYLDAMQSLQICRGGHAKNGKASRRKRLRQHTLPCLLEVVRYRLQDYQARSREQQLGTLALKSGWMPEVLLKSAVAIICACFVDGECERLLVKRFWPRSDCCMRRDAAAIGTHVQAHACGIYAEVS